MLPLSVISTGKALPTREISSADLDFQLGYPAGYVRRRSGIEIRHHAAISEYQSDLAGAAVRDAINRADIPPSSIDLLIGACGVQEQALPSTAARILEPAGLASGTPAFDVNASCLGFLAALHIAASLLAAGTYRRIAIASADLASRGIDWKDAESAMIFGDGAAAIIVEAATEHATTGIHAFRMETYPASRTLCEIRAGGTRCNPRTGAQPADYLFRMQGKRLFKLAAQLIEEFVQRLVSSSDYTLGDMHLVIPHQASHLSIQHIRKRLNLPQGRLVDIYARHGNQVAASIPTAFHEAWNAGRIVSGRPILLLGTAAGLTLGGMVLTT